MQNTGIQVLLVTQGNDSDLDGVCTVSYLRASKVKASPSAHYKRWSVE